jgi:hypothetical protein
MKLEAILTLLFIFNWSFRISEFAQVPSAATLKNKIQSSIVIFSGKYLTSILSLYNITFSANQREISFNIHDAYPTSNSLYPVINVDPNDRFIINAYDNITYTDFHSSWKFAPSFTARGSSVNLCVKLRQHIKVTKNACSYYGGFCSPHFKAQLKHCSLFEPVPLGGGLDHADEHVRIEPTGSFLLVSKSVALTSRGALFYADIMGGVFLSEACLSSPSFYEDVKFSSCGTKITNCTRYPYVLTAAQHWNYEYGHFIGESFPRIIFHFFRLKEQYPNLKLHLENPYNEKNELSGRYYTKILGILVSLGVNKSDVISGPVEADIAFLPREGSIYFLYFV